MRSLWHGSSALLTIPHRFGEAAGERGRVWSIYRDRAEAIDNDLLQGWNETLNTLLVFVGL